MHHQYIQLLRCLALAVLGSQFTYYYLLGCWDLKSGATTPTCVLLTKVKRHIAYSGLQLSNFPTGVIELQFYAMFRFWKRFLCISGNLGTLDQAGLNCVETPTSPSQALRACAISTQLSVKYGILYLFLELRVIKLYQTLNFLRS